MSGFRFPKSWTLLRILAVPLLALFVSCLGGSGSTETEISLTGRVIGKNDAGVQGLIVTLAKTGLKDTTDAQGNYHIQGKTKDAASKGVLDTLLFVLEDRRLASLTVTQWIATLPDLKIIQREFSGNLLPETWPPGGRIEVVVSEDGDSSESMAVEAFYSPPVSRYSTFLYFRASTEVKGYSAYARVYESSGRFVGRSQTLEFNNNAGNILIPSFDAGNARPHAFAGTDTLMNVGDTLRLRGAAVDSFGGAIVKWEWKIGLMGDFQTANSGDTTVILPSQAQPDYPCVLRVTDNDGNISNDTLIVTVSERVEVWTARNSGTSVNFVHVASSGTQWMAVGSFVTGESRLVTSSDGVNWVRDPGTWNDLSTVLWTGTQWVAFQSQVAYRSTNGSQWTAGGGGLGKLPVAVWNGSQFVAVSEMGGIATSPDAIVWTPRVSGTTLDLYGIAWTGSQYVAVGKDGILLTSPDGITWSPRATGIATSRGKALYSVAWNGTRLVAVGDSGRVLTSSDGITWVPGHSGTENTLRNVTWLGDRFLAVGMQGVIRKSQDGLTWSESLSGVTNELTSSAQSGSRRVVVGSDGLILSSP